MGQKWGYVRRNSKEDRMKKVGPALFLVILFLLVPLFPVQGAGPKNVILLIGDGMGPEAVGLAIYYNLFTKGPGKPLNLEKLMAEIGRAHV